MQKRFYFNRKKDLSGNSGTGKVAEGVEFSNGTCVVCWLTETTSTTVYRNIDDVIALHGHEGATEVVFIDKDEDKRQNAFLNAGKGENDNAD